jgi:hypothetical protein
MVSKDHTKNSFLTLFLGSWKGVKRESFHMFSLLLKPKLKPRKNKHTNNPKQCASITKIKKQQKMLNINND